jgi:4-hydroxybenzoate polyprenyltransferase
LIPSKINIKSPSSIGTVLSVLRSNDWLQSFVPFVMGCVYLWLVWFNFSFSSSLLIVIGLSLLTTVGFASLGYFINEFFDKESDTKAGKINKLSLIPLWSQFAILVAILLVTFLPWNWLPRDQISYFLIFLQIGLFLAYSMPIPRLKETSYASLVLDALYAYPVPLLLSFHTFSLLSGNQAYPSWFVLFVVASFFIGIRNIITHQIQDIFKDAASGLRTFPMVIGVNQTKTVQTIVFAYEVFFVSIAILVFSYHFWFVLFVLVGYWIHGWYVFVYHGNLENPSKMYLEINKAYSLVFPILVLLFLSLKWPFGWIVLLVHGSILVPFNFWKLGYNLIIPLVIRLRIAFHRFLVMNVRHFLSLCINYFIYFLFKLVGVDLKKEGMSAIDYLRKRRKG